MLRITGISLPLSYTDGDLRRRAADLLGVAPGAITACELRKRSVDARKKEAVHFIATVDVTVEGEEKLLRRHVKNNKISRVEDSPYILPPSISPPAVPPVVVGSGPAGLFAALTLAQAGARPILMERGGDVDSRRAAVETFRRTGVLDTASNVQFGEGGAGTFSDGKLNSGIKDPRCRRVLETFVAAGAPGEILWQAKPHIGTDRLQDTVRGLRREILRLGGQVLFYHRLTDLVIKDGALSSVLVETPEGVREIPCRQVILAIGHSARDTAEMLCRRGLPMEQKPFAVGVRVEHPRAMIDTSQYGPAAGHPALGAADYKLSCRPDGGRGVYTFCMCPGGVVMAAASEEGGVAVNGMSEHARDAENSNSALLVGVEPGDFGSEHPLAGFAFQRKMEQAAYRLGGGDYRAPAQLVGDFLAGRASVGGGEVTPSYLPGVTWADLRECLPAFVSNSLRAALPMFGRQLTGFDRPDAVLTGVESRSSSPVRLLRDSRGQSAIGGVYPCGEGAGYAGGIMSAAVDGIRCAEWVLASLE
ncbi:MAG: FAD-binding protein [Clostridia bacterium]|nr:FAD-binding protein [Clostridia bacterium]